MKVQDPPAPPRDAGQENAHGLPARLPWEVLGEGRSGLCFELCSELPSGSSSLPWATFAVEQLSSFTPTFPNGLSTILI